MKEFVLKVIFGTTLFFLLWFLMMRYVSQLPSESPLRIAIEGKMKILKQQEKTKIVLIGDSNLALGINSASIKSATGLEVVNMGVHGGFGLRFSLAQIKDYLQPNDIVLLSPVLGAFSDDFYGSTQLNLALRSNLAFLKYVATFKQLAKIFPQGINVRDFYASLRNYTPTQSYQIGMNEYGDYTGHHNLPNRQIFNENSPIDSLILAETVAELNLFEAEMKVKNIHFFYTYSPLPQSLHLKHLAKINRYELSLDSLLNMPILGAAADMVYPDSLFFDTKNHLNFKGKELRTAALIGFLQKELAAISYK